MVELSILETEFPTDSDPQTEAVLHGKEHVLWDDCLWTISHPLGKLTAESRAETLYANQTGVCLYLLKTEFLNEERVEENQQNHTDNELVSMTFYKRAFNIRPVCYSGPHHLEIKETLNLFDVKATWDKKAFLGLK